MIQLAQEKEQVRGRPKGEEREEEEQINQGNEMRGVAVAVGEKDTPNESYSQIERGIGTVTGGGGEKEDKLRSQVSWKER
jgi:hypothetical protein